MGADAAAGPVDAAGGLAELIGVNDAKDCDCDAADDVAVPTRSARKRRLSACGVPAPTVEVDS